MAGARAPPQHGGNANPMEERMNLPSFRSLPADQEGRVGYILLWLLGVPIPILFLFYLLRGCT